MPNVLTDLSMDTTTYYIYWNSREDQHVAQSTTKVSLYTTEGLLERTIF